LPSRRSHKTALGTRGSLVLWALLLLALAWAVGALVYVASFPERMSTLTEFYVLSVEKKAIGYPYEMEVGEEGVVLVGIRNMENKAIDYWMKVTIAGEEGQTLGPISLAPEESWEKEVLFIPTWAGEQQKVEFLLYEGAPRRDEKPYRSLFLLVNVR